MPRCGLIYIDQPYLTPIGTVFLSSTLRAFPKTNKSCTELHKYLVNVAYLVLRLKWHNPIHPDMPQEDRLKPAVPFDPES